MRMASRPSSPQPRSKPKLEKQLVDAIAAHSTQGPEGVRISADELLMRLKPLKGASPNDLTTCIADNETSQIYCIGGNQVSNFSELWCLPTSTMEWRTVPMRATVKDVFLPVNLPFRLCPGLALLGPRDHRHLLLFGGQDADGNKTSDLFYIDLLMETWSLIFLEGGNIMPRSMPEMILTDDCKLFIFGGRSEAEWLKSFSLAVLDPLTLMWTWLIRDQELHSALTTEHRMVAAPLYDGKKFLVIGTSFQSSKKWFDVENEHIFTFDPKTFKTIPDLHVQPGDSPLLLDIYVLQPGFAANEVIVSASHDGKWYELWSYCAFPENEWRRLLKFSLSPNVDFRDQFVINCTKKTYVLMFDRRDGKKGVNAYLELDELREAWITN